MLTRNVGQLFPSFVLLGDTSVDSRKMPGIREKSPMPGILCCGCMADSSEVRALAELLGVKSSGGIHKWSFSLLRGALDTSFLRLALFH